MLQGHINKLLHTSNWPLCGVVIINLAGYMERLTQLSPPLTTVQLGL